MDQPILEVINVAFPDRQSRSEYIFNSYPELFLDGVLDVGCSEAPLRKRLKSDRYVGIDIGGEPDRFVDLEAVACIPYKDGEFAAVLCIDVLEHLDALHRIYAELFRVSGRYVLVSLPNCWCLARKKIARGHGQFSHYGLPLEKPEDRHKWFFCVSQIVHFFTENRASQGFQLVRLSVLEKPRPLAVRLIRKLRYSPMPYLNRYAHSVYALFRRS